MNNIIESLYIHFPYCKHLCNYCDFFKSQEQSPDTSKFEQDLLKMELAQGDLLKKWGMTTASLKTLYIGGGTPSLWINGPMFLDSFLSRMFGASWSSESDFEFTVEMNPGTINENVLKNWMSIGANRFSIGVQSLDDQYLQSLDRIHRKEDVLKTLGLFNDLKCNFSVDLMLGLARPGGQKKRDIIKEVNEIVSFNPSHFSVYILTVNKNYCHYKSLPSEDEIAQEYLNLVRELGERGYKQYEVSNFSLPTKESKHNLKYWKSESVMALGPSATGLLIMENDHAIRYKWKTQDTLFETETLGQKELALERLYMKWRTSLGVTADDFLPFCGQETFFKLISRWLEAGFMVEGSTSGHHPTALGYLNLDTMLNQLFLEVR